MRYDETTKQAAIYAYATLQSQTERNDALQQQINGCTEYIMRQGYFLRGTNIYKDIVTDRHGDNRPQFALLREAMQRHEVQVVVVYGLNRLAPKLASIGAFLDEAELLGIQVESALESQRDAQLIKKRIKANNPEHNS